MIYFDSAATSWPKPPEVWQAMEHFIKEVGASPGRAGHKRTVEANRIVDETRQQLAELFNIDDHKRIIFTLNATDSLNLAIKGLLRPGDHVITSSMEHNSVTRPLYTLQSYGVQVTKVPCDQQGNINLDDIERAFLPNTKAIIMTHASNVTGTIMPVEEVGRLAARHKVYFVMDAAQTAGLLDIDVKKLNISILTFPGHKSLLGPQGTGGIYIKEGVELMTLREGGTGSGSETPTQPDMMPEKYESGTLNAVGIAGLGAGVKYVRRVGLKKIRDHEMNLTKRFLDGAAAIPGMHIYGLSDLTKRVSVVSFRIDGYKAGEVGDRLDKKYDIACRAGLHCAPDAHRTLGTFEEKLVRFSFSYFNTAEEVDFALNALKEIAVARQPEVATLPV
ncbi:cysteine desulfurase family protein [Desulfotomaculum nigrificans CO-1-SRB]|uniref:cysteine desulfurase n=1 Tax=Desulfotomaculum nigrificans (strain DSM 14880 / VKM B-2319 / CO-1-SRB) TaxID=868595 RepID=F6B5T0_DESCC|nr:aminotransferase class V-fold PLP-dependent enzyme [Desulfotomaculum nigrificans]AEF93153.1 cysteine desulfurase family protein [Desulfotomaculum nigrificans CO-1-SRB]